MRTLHFWLGPATRGGYDTRREAPDDTAMGACSHVRPHDPPAARAQLVALAAGAVLARRLHRDHVLGPDERLHAALSANAGRRAARCGAVDGHRRLGLERGWAAVPAVLGGAGGSLCAPAGDRALVRRACAGGNAGDP